MGRLLVLDHVLLLLSVLLLHLLRLLLVTLLHLLLLRLAGLLFGQLLMFLILFLLELLMLLLLLLVKLLLLLLVFLVQLGIAGIRGRRPLVRRKLIWVNRSVTRVGGSGSVIGTSGRRVVMCGGSGGLNVRSEVCGFGSCGNGGPAMVDRSA